VNKYLDQNLYYEISAVISKFYPYSIEDICREVEEYKSVDVVLNGIKVSLEQNVSLEHGCHWASL